MRRYVSALVSPSQRVGLVGQPDVQRVPVGVCVDGDAAERGVAAGPDDADRDLAPVGDEHLAHVDRPPGLTTLACCSLTTV